MTYRQQISGHTYQFDGLVDVLAKATPLRSGDELAGCAAESDAERAAARDTRPRASRRAPLPAPNNALAFALADDGFFECEVCRALID